MSGERKFSQRDFKKIRVVLPVETDNLFDKFLALVIYPNMAINKENSA